MELQKNVAIFDWEQGRNSAPRDEQKSPAVENVLPQIVYCTKICVSLYHMGWQFSCHHITGRNVKDLS